MNEKIAILTLYYKNNNYGGNLQAYALQTVLEHMGYNVAQVSYDLMSGYKGWNPIKSCIKRPLAYLYHLIKYGDWYNKYRLQNRKIQKFAKSIPHTKVVTKKTISDLNNQFDFFICGSDQIWNPIGWQPTLFFDFLPDDKKRISYAASIARDKLAEEEYAFMQPYLDKFSIISVREKNAAEMLNQKFPDLNVQAVPDPVFLLGIDEWVNLIPQNAEEKEAYIFAYFLGGNEENRQKAIQYAKDRKLKIRFASYMNYTQSKWDKEHPELLAPPTGVEDFLQNIANAELVLTDSFHAVAFSSILETPFYVLPRFKAQDGNSMNSRIVNIVQELNIKERYTENIGEDYRWSDIEKENLKKNLKKLQERGIQFLSNALE